jgi:hypothetical protein
VCLGCVVRVESTGQEYTTSLWDKSCWGDVTWAFPSEVPVAGTCVEVVPGWSVFVERSPGKEVSLGHGVLVKP